MHGHHFPNISPWGFFQMLKGRLVCSQWSVELIRALMYLFVPCKYGKIQFKIAEVCMDNIFTMRSLWELSVAIETRVLIQSASNPNAGNSPPQ